MTRVYIPQMKPVPSGANQEERRKMYDEYRAELARMNPGHFNSGGRQKSVWQWVKGVFT